MNRRRITIILATAAALVFSGGVAALAASGASASAAAPPEYCVLHGPAGTNNATGNWVLYNWSHVNCPRGTYGHTTADPDPTTGPVAPDVDNFLGTTFQTGHSGSNTADTTFKVIDNTNNGAGAATGAVSYTCHLTVPAQVSAGPPATFAPGILCAKDA